MVSVKQGFAADSANTRERQVAFLTYNIEGLANIYDSDTCRYIQKFDFALIVETFSGTFPSSLFPDHDVFVVPGVRLSESVTARLSGGVALLVRKEFSRYVEHIEIEYDNFIAMKVDGQLVGSSADLILLGVYLPPSGSPYYADTEITNGVALVEQCVLDIIEKFGDLEFMLLGDFNARTGVECPQGKNIPEDILDESDCGTAAMRRSRDETVNCFGRYLLNICEQFDWCILNGFVSGDEEGHFTYISASGCSVIDYFVLSRALLPLCVFLKVGDYVTSKHMPVEFSMHSSDTASDAEKGYNRPFRLSKYVWNDSRSQEFLQSLESEDVKTCFDEAMLFADYDIDVAIESFNKGLLAAGKCMKKDLWIGDQRNVWFDIECRQSRAFLRSQLRAFHRKHTEENRLSYIKKGGNTKNS